MLNMLLSGSASGITPIVDAMSDVLGLVDVVIETMLGQPILLFFVAVGFVPVGIKLFRSLKGAAKS